MRNLIVAVAMSDQGNVTNILIRQRVGVFRWLCVVNERKNRSVSLDVSFKRDKVQSLTSRSGIDIEIPRASVTIHTSPVERLRTLRKTDEHGSPRSGGEAPPAHSRHTGFSS